VLAKAAVAAGADALFFEVHPNPEKALCDGDNMLALDKAEAVFKVCKEIYEIVNPPAADAAPPFNKGGIKIKVIHTPGHTEGCVCYLIDGKLFSGDTLFFETVGRTDLPGGNFKKIENSVKNILFQLDDNTVVYPGHGAETTIGHEKMYNEIL
jgi:glyoxylase-like metal-dependent hydrolase (beta-lactamase superfamily II)